MLKKIISIAVSSIAVLSIIGCSNQSPLSVGNNENAPVKEALFKDIQASDLGGSGGKNWAVHKTDANGSNFWFYYFNTQTANWVKTSHWGKRLAVTGYGRCYHYNSANDIWCARYKINGGVVDDSSGHVVDPQLDPAEATIDDIGAGYVSKNTDAIWILINMRTIYKGYIINNVFDHWEYKGVLPTNAYGWSIAADPSNGNVAYVSGALVQSSRAVTQIYEVTNSNENTPPSLKYTGSTLLNTTSAYYNGTDVAVSNGKVIYVDLDGNPSMYGVFLASNRQKLQSTSRSGLFCDPSMYGYIQTNNTPMYKLWN